MKPTFLVFAILLVSAFALPLSAGPETPAQAFADGERLLAGADFDGALAAFARAARADRENQQYLQHYAMVRRILLLREQLDTEQDDARWEYQARALHSFYISRGLYREALALDRKMHQRLSTASTAVLLAETELALDMNSEAARTLAGLPAEKQTEATRALHGLALARQGKVDEAKQIAAGVELNGEAGPAMLYRVARLTAAVGDNERSLALLTRCFESVAPSQLAAFKDHAQRNPEFGKLASKPEFSRVLQTESKVPESKCSGGSGCSGCPMRGNCGKGGGG
ncbi:MAG: hypothetical protein GXY83_07035 [Rhodopirellula sp.]|nr:hypothetical protein [Rhodopirellula sp.]